MATQTLLQGAEYDSAIKNKTLGEFLVERGKQYGSSICQLDAVTGQSETYSSVLTRSTKLAIQLQKRGITSKDVILCCSINTLDNTIPIIATFLLGAKIANTDPSVSLRNTTHLVSLVKPKIIFVQEASLDLIQDSLKSANLQAEIVVFGQSTDYLEFDSLISSDADEELFRLPKVDVEETAILLFSSGSTGLPKAICHSHSSFLQVVEIQMQFALYDGRDDFKLLHFTNFYWMTALISLVTCFWSGTTRVFSTKSDGASMLEAVERHKISALFMAPVLTYNLINMDDTGKYDTSSLRILICVGTPMSAAQYEKLYTIFPNIFVLLAYAASETGVITNFDIRRDYLFIKKKLGSSGKVAPKTTIKIVDLNTEEALGQDQKGEIRVKTPAIMTGYYNMDSTSCFDEEGYFKTGDVGYYDEDKCLYVVDRIKEMFKYKSWHIVPSSLEAVLMEHPDVRDAVVFGLPQNEEIGEVPAACVVLNENSTVTANEISEFVAERVSDIEQLRGGVTIWDSLPKTPTGKPMRREVKNKISNL